VSINEIRDGSRMESMKNGADVEGADNEICRAWIKFDVARKQVK